MTAEYSATSTVSLHIHADTSVTRMVTRLTRTFAVRWVRRGRSVYALRCSLYTAVRDDFRSATRRLPAHAGRCAAAGSRGRAKHAGGHTWRHFGEIPRATRAQISSLSSISTLRSVARGMGRRRRGSCIHQSVHSHRCGVQGSDRASTELPATRPRQTRVRSSGRCSFGVVGALEFLCFYSD